jgi:signal transduction histidine kinase
MELEPDQGLAGKVFATGETSVSENVGDEQAHLREVGERVGYVTTNMVTVPLRSASAELLGVMQVLNKRGSPFDEHDVRLIETISAQIATALVAARLQEQARLATVVRFIGNISHDVKNMVTPAMVGAETLRLIADECFLKLDQALEPSAGPSAGRAEPIDAMASLRRHYVEIVEMIIEGCDTVQQRMADISAAVKGIVSKPQFELSDVLAIARRVATMLSLQADKKRVALTIEPIRDLPAAMIDSKQMHNAIYNLVFNAIDACREGDAVVVRLDCRADGEFPTGNYILLECADTGPGIPARVKAKLFTDEAVSTKPMGTGLGTKIVKNVIDAHDGTIEVETELNVGTTIRCRVPIARGPASVRSRTG